MADSYASRREDIRLWCESVGAKRVYQSNAHMRVIMSRLERYEEETGNRYPGPGNWGRDSHE